MEEKEKSGGSEPVRLAELEDDVGHAVELTPQERARLGLANRLLLVILVLVVAAGAALLFAPADRLSEARELFEFVKTSAAPLVTLVLGFYFRSESA